MNTGMQMININHRPRFKQSVLFETALCITVLCSLCYVHVFSYGWVHTSIFLCIHKWCSAIDTFYQTLT